MGAVIAVQGAVSFSMAVLGFLLLFAVGFWAYGLRVAGNWALIAALLLLCMASIFALGFFFTAIAPTERICQLLCYIAYFLMLFLSGASFPQEMLPETVRKISALLPLTHAVNVLRGAFRGAPWEEYQASVFVLVRRGTRLRPGRRAAIPQKELGVNRATVAGIERRATNFPPALCPQRSSSAIVGLAPCFHCPKYITGPTPALANGPALSAYIPPAAVFPDTFSDESAHPAPILSVSCSAFYPQFCPNIAAAR